MSQATTPVPVIAPHSYPLWVMGFAALVVAATVYASLSIPRYYRAAKDEADARHALAAGDTGTAERLGREALDIAPTSKAVKMGLAKAMFADADPANDDDALDLLTGLKLDESDWKDLTTVMPQKYQDLFTKTKEN